MAMSLGFKPPRKKACLPTAESTTPAIGKEESEEPTPAGEDTDPENTSEEDPLVIIEDIRAALEELEHHFLRIRSSN